MKDLLQEWAGKITSNPILIPFKWIKNWMETNVIKRKIFIFLTIFSVWISLLMGAFLSPQRQTFTEEQLKIKNTFRNGTGEIKLVSQEYSPKTGVIVLQFETRDSTSPVARGIDPKRLKWNLYAQQKSSKTTMDVVPILDNKISVIIRDVAKNFGAFAIDVTNNTVSTNLVDIEISSSDEEVRVLQKNSDEDKVVQFYVTPQNSELKTKTIKVVSREEFTLQEIKKEREFQKRQEAKIKASIKQLQASIEDDESRKESLSFEAKYLTGEDLEDNRRGILLLDSNIESKNQSIKVASDNIEKITLKLETLDRKQRDVENGTFEFSSPIETVEME